MNKQNPFDRPTCTDVMTMAERELAAFISAVTELFGSGQARLSAEDWLDELELMDSLPGSTSRDWRRVTVAASARLASRLTPSPKELRPSVPATSKAGQLCPASPGCVESALQIKSNYEPIG